MYDSRMMNKIKPKFGIAIFIASTALAITGCYSHTEGTTHESEDISNARILCRHLNKVFENNKEAFNLAIAKSNNDFVKYFCIPDEELILPGSPGSEKIKYPTPYVIERPKLKKKVKE